MQFYDTYAVLHRISGRASHVRVGANFLRTAEREQARQDYQYCLQLDPSAAAAHRGLGLSARAAGDDANARAELTRYLTLAPNAPDRRYVESLLSAPGAAQ